MNIKHHKEILPLTTKVHITGNYVIRKFIDDILPGLYSLKNTYPCTKEIIAKVDSIILTLIDFKNKTEDYINQKNKGIKLLVKNL